jgi:hypothetical protein
MKRTLSLALVLAMAAVALLPGGSATAGASTVTLPTANVGWDYQIGGAFTPAPDVAMVSRDRGDSPAPGLYNVCYVNAFQTQSDEKKFWHKHWSLVLKDHGEAVVDENWGEWLLDTSTAAKRKALIKIVGRWIDGCASSGFDATEFDNLDSFNRSHHLLTPQDNKAFASLLTARAHQDGLAAAQKNWAGMDGTKLGFDFAITEECARYKECQRYVADYGDLVFDIEYRTKDFTAACQQWGDELSIVHRNLDVTPKGVDQRC